MVRKILRILACIVIAAIVGTTVGSLYTTTLVVMNVGAYGVWGYIQQKFVEIFPVLLISNFAVSALMMGLALLFRRAGLSLFRAFAGACLALTVVGSALVFFTEGASGDIFGYLLALAGTNLVLDGIRAGVMGLLYRWLSGRKPKLAPEVAF